MKEKGAGGLTMHCSVDGDAFWEYALYNVFRREKLWRAPVIFAAVFSAFAAVCFLFRDRQRGAALLGGVLLVIGWGLPAFYLGSYLLRLRQQTKALTAAGKKTQFTLALDGDGVRIKRGEQTEAWPWAEICLVCRLKRSICIYPEPRKAFLVAGEDGEAERAWAVLRKNLPGEKISDLSRSRPAGRR